MLLEYYAQSELWLNFVLQAYINPKSLRLRCYWYHAFFLISLLHRSNWCTIPYYNLDRRESISSMYQRCFGTMRESEKSQANEHKTCFPLRYL